jgi:hypothetical protein
VTAIERRGFHGASPRLRAINEDIKGSWPPPPW